MRSTIRDLAPIGTFRIRIEHARVGDGVPLVVGSERGIGGRLIGDIGVEGRHGFLSTRTVHDEFVQKNL